MAQMSKTKKPAGGFRTIRRMDTRTSVPATRTSAPAVRGSSDFIALEKRSHKQTVKREGGIRNKTR